MNVINAKHDEITLLLGSHRDVVSRTHVVDALKRINADYGGFAGSSLKGPDLY